MEEAHVAFLLELDNMTAVTMVRGGLSPTVASTDILR